MPSIVNIHEAKTHFSKLLARVCEGEEIIIARAGKPVAKLSAVKATGERPIGIDRGKIWIAPDFNAPMTEDELKEWCGSGKTDLLQDSTK